MKEEETDKYNVSEEGLRDWFGKSSGTTKSGRKVRGWVQVGGKYDGKPCARQPGQKSTPKCVSSSKRRSMSKKERDSAARRKRAADPNQPQKSGAAKPTNVSTDPKKKMKENYFNRNKVVEGFKGYADLSHMQTPKQKKEAEERLKKFTANTYREMKKKDKIKIGESKNPRKNKNDRRKEDLAIERQLGLPKRTDGSHLPQQFRSESKQHIDEAKDKKGKGSGTKDACYHKVKSRYSVWPSAYASGALVKCRKVGAANWGNKSKNEGFSPMQVSALEAAGMIEIKEGQKCWKGYEKKGTKMMFGKRYNNCVKKKATKEEVEIQELMGNPSFNIKGGEASKQMTSDALKSKRKNKRDENIRNLANNPGTKGEESAALAKKKPQAELPNFSKAKVTEGVAFLKRKKEKKNSEVERKPKKAMDAGARLRRKKQRQEYAAKISGSEDNVPDDIRDHVELTAESKTRLVKNGHTYKVILTWRGKTYMVQMFVPSVSRPTRQQVEKEVQKIYPDAKLMSFLPKDLEPGEPTVMMGEEFGKMTPKQEREYTGLSGAGIRKLKKDMTKKGNFDVKKNLARKTPDEQHTTTTSEAYSSKPSNLRKKAKLTAALNRLQDLKVKKKMSEEQDPEGMKLSDVQRIKRQKQLSDAAKKAPEVKNKIVPIKTSTTEEVIHEDDMKGMSVKSGHKRPTKSGAGMTAKGVAAYRRRNPGSKLKTAVTGKVKKGSKDAKRRKSYCARSAGQMKKFPKAAKDPNSRLRQARRRWKC